MDTGFRDTFIRLWSEYFPDSDLPVTFDITDNTRDIPHAPAPDGWRCLVCDLHKSAGVHRCFLMRPQSPAPAGRSLPGSQGREVLNSGISCRTERKGWSAGSGTKKRRNWSMRPPSGWKAIPHRERSLFRRWDKLDEQDTPEVVIFFARPEVLKRPFHAREFRPR